MTVAARIVSIADRLRRRRVVPVPLVTANTFVQPGNQWYQPTLAGALTMASYIGGGAVVRDALAVLEQLTPDTYADFVGRFYRAGLEKYGDGWQYADINTALLGLSSILQPETYLEIGVRHGRSLAMVASRTQSCRIWAADLFVENYAGMDNPGPEFVRRELRRVGFTGSLEFILGDSATVLPAYLDRHPELHFDLVTVDGDHSARGARIDLLTVLPRLKIGGALVFDDVSNESHPELLTVWQDVVVCHPRFSTHTFTDVGFGVGIAIRRS